MRVAVFGLGYVGTVTSTCLALEGHLITGVDRNLDKVSAIVGGESPVLEPGLDEAVRRVVESGNLTATGDVEQALADASVSLVCVGTPSKPNGGLDTEHVEQVAHEIGTALATHDEYHVVAIRSTVLPGTAERIILPILEQSSGRTAGRDFGLSVNPEFLREGSAMVDFRNPSYTLIGELDVRSGDLVSDLYQSIAAPTVRTELATAEMAKYVSNAFHALKVAFANEIGNLAKLQGLDGQEVMEIFCHDDKLNLSSSYLTPGFAFGGSCLPKDTRALVRRASELDADSPLLRSILPSNRAHIDRAIGLVESLGRRRVGVCGLSFKPGIDDVRESPAVRLIETLVGRGYEVVVYDPNVQPGRLVGANKAYLSEELPHIASLMSTGLDEVVTSSDVVVLTNDSPEFKEVRSLLRPDQALVDLTGVGKDDTAEGIYEGLGW